MVELIFDSVINSNSWRRTSSRYVGPNNCLDLIVELILNFIVDDRIVMKVLLQRIDLRDKTDYLD